MLKQTEAYRAAITGDARKILLKAVLDIIDPDITYGTATSSGAEEFARPEQLHDKNWEQPRPMATLEEKRWMLDGSFELLPDDPAEVTGSVGFVGDAVSGADGTFSTAPWVQLNFSHVRILQACSVYFTTAEYDGVPEDFTVEVLQGGVAYHSRQYTGNRSSSVSLTDFTVENPDAIRVTVTKWSLPYRRMRVLEIIPGIYEVWTGDDLAAFSVNHSTDFSSLSLPYGTCDIELDNLDRRFEPRNPKGLFRSIEERQGIQTSIGVELPDGSVDYQPAGVFYQHNDGWKTSANGATMEWHLADMIGLLTQRQFLPGPQLPTTLDGWIAALAAQLGDNFVGRYHVDPAYGDKPLTVRSPEDLENATCGSVLRWACQATGTFARADAETGALTVEPMWSQGNSYELSNLGEYPTMMANRDLAAIIFTLADGAGTKYVVSGNSTAASDTSSVTNPFIHTTAEALTAARQILAQYGGNSIALVGRGDPSSEIGDVATVQLDESQATTARIMSQSFTVQGGVLRDCKSQLLQASGAMLYSQRAAFTAPGTWTAPAGVKQLRLILVGPGGTGTDGTDGSWAAAGEDGVDGPGGLVWHGVVDINDGQTFDVSVSDTATTFGPYSSADGQQYPNGFTDLDSGSSYARTGVEKPLPGSGDGGVRGRGGQQGVRSIEKVYDESGVLVGYETVVHSRPQRGTKGTAGAIGCAVVYWEAV